MTAATGVPPPAGAPQVGAPQVRAPQVGAPGAPRWLRRAALGVAAAAALLVFTVLVYELARARVPQHRAALERLVRAQTGLDVRFAELGLRWGWYGPEVAFRRVELGEPAKGGAARTLLRAPELIVGFDAWRTLRSGHPEAGRIRLVAADIDFAALAPASTRTPPGREPGVAPGSARVAAPANAGVAPLTVLQRWRGGRIDLEGGTLRLPAPVGPAGAVTLQIRRASLHRSADEWTLSGLVFLPDRLGRSARLTLRVSGDLDQPERLAGTLRIEGRRVLLRGWRDLLAGQPALAGSLPGSADGDWTTELAFTAAEVRFDWDAARPTARRLQTSADIEDLAFVPRSHDFVLSGLLARVTGSEAGFSASVYSRAARLELAQSLRTLADLQVRSTLKWSRTAAGWRISTDEFLLQHAQARLVLDGSISGRAGAPDEIDARGALTGADIPFVKDLVGGATAQVFGAAASQLVAGEIHDARFTLRGPLDALPLGTGGAGLSGSLVLRDAVLSGGDLWPDMVGVMARVQWQGTKIQASLDAGRAGPFQITAARAQWDARGAGGTRLTGRIGGRLEDAVTWVREHPPLQAYAPGVRDLAASGSARFDLDVDIPAVRSDGHARVAISFDAASLQALDGLPPLHDLSGALVFNSGHLEQSVLEGSWLGGPLTLRIAEQRDHGNARIRVQAHGTATAAELMEATDSGAGLQGSTDWSGTFDYLTPAQGRAPRWRLRADSSLLGLVSTLPEPFAKRAAMAVPAQIELSGGDSAALARVSLGDRARGVVALKRAQERGWRIDRGALHLGGAAQGDTAAASEPLSLGAAAVAAKMTPPRLPMESVVLVEGRLGKLDLPAYAIGLRSLRADLLPPVRARIDAAQLVAGGRTYDSASMQAERTAQGTDLLIESEGLAGTAHWPALSPASEMPDGTALWAGLRTAQRTATIHLARLDLADPLTSGGAALLAALAPLARVSVDELNWHGRALGRMSAEVSVQDDRVTLDDMLLTAGRQQARGALRCQKEPAACHLTFDAASSDAAATLEDFGFRREVSAREGTFSGDLQWPWAAPNWLAAVRGTVSLRLADGSVAGPSAGLTGRRFPLLAIPALLGGLEAGVAADMDLPFTRLAADFDLAEGQAATSNLHLDGDAEILMRGRIGLVARDYDQQVWVLRGEERLPAAIRRFGATPGVAAAWLGLREFLAGGSEPPRSHAALRLQGSWDDPIVAAAN